MSVRSTKRNANPRRALKRLWSSVEVKSVAGGWFVVHPTWAKEFRRPGVLTRLHAAALLEDLIHGQ